MRGTWRANERELRAVGSDVEAVGDGVDRALAGLDGRLAGRLGGPAQGAWQVPGALHAAAADWHRYLAGRAQEAHTLGTNIGRAAAAMADSDARAGDRFGKTSVR